MRHSKVPGIEIVDDHNRRIKRLFYYQLYCQSLQYDVFNQSDHNL